jgi:hypothetical protein
LKVLRIPLAPPAVIRNRALEHVQLPWVAYCDGDDVWCEQKTLVQLAHAKTSECDLIGVDHYLTDEDGKIRAIALAKYLPMLSSWMVRTEIMRRHPFNEAESLRGVEDSEWWRRTDELVRKVRCPQLLLRYRVRAGSISVREPSKRRKARVVSAGSIPVLGWAVLALTWCAWLSGRKTHYLRLKKKDKGLRSPQASANKVS